MNELPIKMLRWAMRVALYPQHWYEIFYFYIAFGMVMGLALVLPWLKDKE